MSPRFSACNIQELLCKWYIIYILYIIIYVHVHIMARCFVTLTFANLIRYDEERVKKLF
mgnify:CR=1 FL=1